MTVKISDRQMSMSSQWDRDEEPGNGQPCVHETRSEVGPRGASEHSKVTREERGRDWGESGSRAAHAVGGLRTALDYMKHVMGRKASRGLGETCWRSGYVLERWRINRPREW